MKEMTDRRYIGVLCRRNHKYQRHNASLRYWNGDCTECGRLRELARRKANPGKYRKRQAANHKKNKKKIAAYLKENRVKIKKQKQLWYLKNKKKKKNETSPVEQS